MLASYVGEWYSTFMERDTKKIPSIATGRRGGMSVADAIVISLWVDSSNNLDWPELSISMIVEKCQEELGYAVKDCTVRSILYRHEEVFEKERVANKGLVYRLSKEFIERHHG